MPDLDNTHEEMEQAPPEAAIAESEALAPEAAALEETAVEDSKHWYIIHTYSGFERKVAESLRTRAEAFGFRRRRFSGSRPDRRGSLERFEKPTRRVGQGQDHGSNGRLFQAS